MHRHITMNLHGIENLRLVTFPKSTTIHEQAHTRHAAQAYTQYLNICQQEDELHVLVFGKLSTERSHVIYMLYILHHTYCIGA